MGNNTPLFRIMPLERFLELLYTRQNVLVRPTLWNDPYESIIEKSAMMSNPDTLELYDITRWYGQCWSCKPESDALWRVFSNGAVVRSVKIKTTVEAIKNQLAEDDIIKDFILLKVKYADYAYKKKDVRKKLAETFQFGWEFSYDCLDLNSQIDNDPQMRAAYMLLTKRNQFNFEEEVRLLAYCHQPQEEKVYKYPIHDLGSFIHEVVIDPWAPDELVDTLRDIVRHYIPATNIPVTKSDLYEKQYSGFLYDPHKWYDDWYQKRMLSPGTNKV